MLAALHNTEGKADVCRLILEDERCKNMNSASCKGGVFIALADTGTNGDAADFTSMKEMCGLIRSKQINSELIRGNVAPGLH